MTATQTPTAPPPRHIRRPTVARVDQRGRRRNVGLGERALSLGTGGLLLLWGVRQRSRLGAAAGVLGGAMLYRGARGYCPAYNALGINHARRGHAEARDFFDRGVHVEASVTVNRPPDELYRFWRNFENLPRFMSHLASVRVLDNIRSRWSAHAPADRQVGWDAAVIHEIENELIAWRSLEGADVDNAGSVRFVGTPDRGTEVRVVLEYIPPGGQLGRLVARLYGEEPQQQVNEDLRRFKALMEGGEVATVQGQSRGQCIA